MTIYLDFDGTVLRHEYPNLGSYNEGCREVLIKLKEAGHDIILNTMRVEFRNNSLDEAYQWLEEFIPELKNIKHTNHKIDPLLFDMDNIINNELFIDDIADNIPMKKYTVDSGWCVDWIKLDEIFIKYNLYKKI